jgi:iron complex outermembrane receptor protein
MKKHILACFVLFFYSLTLYAQDKVYAQEKDSLSQLLELSIENLMSINVYSASKSEEPIFEAPLSIFVITKEQIKNAGCTSIMEALRLAPGVIVREQTNGNYDIHLNGLDNIPPNSNLVFFTSSTTLVMINNRPVYNYLHGGTFWETFPISLNDVEQIEIVRGPCSAMYGPNAVSGVINIITRKPQKEGPYATAVAMYGSYNALSTSAAVGYKWKKNFSALVSGNYITRNRIQTDYYDVTRNQYLPLDSVTAIKNNVLRNTSEAYPDRDQAFKKACINAFLDYDPNKDVSLSLSLGAQDSRVQKEFGTGFTPITTSTSETKYAYLRGRVRDFTFQASHLRGTESPSLGQRIWKWDLNTTDINVEYNITKIKNLTLRPGVIYRLAIYDDNQYVDVSKKEGLWNGQARTETKAASLYADYRMAKDKLRLVGAARFDDFNYPSKNYLSYQVATTYKLNENNLLRLYYGRSYRTPLLIDLFSNLDITGPFNLKNPPQTFVYQIRGNKDIRLLRSDMITAGYRSKLRDDLQLNLSFSRITARDFSDLVTKSGSIDSTGPVSLTALVQLDNLTLHTEQYTGTASLTFVRKKWQVTPFITVQQTWLHDYSPYNYAPTAPLLLTGGLDATKFNIYSNSGTKIKHLATPTYYGGFYVNWMPTEKINVNVNSYFFGEQTQLESSNKTYNDQKRGVENIEGKLLLNAVVSYKPIKSLTLSANFRNCLNSTSREFYRADETAFMFFGCAYFEL